MSELTFNIADYRPLFRPKTHETGHAIKTGGGFVVLSANSQPREYEPDEWYAPRPSVVDIRTVREAHRPSPRRGKILRFSNPASHRLYTMPAPESHPLDDDDPDPLVA